MRVTKLQLFALLVVSVTVAGSSRSVRNVKKSPIRSFKELVADVGVRGEYTSCTHLREGSATDLKHRSSSKMERTSASIQTSENDASSRGLRKLKNREKIIARQILRLMKMKCKPYPKKMYVRDEMDETDDRRDKPLIPQVVSIRRCDDSCSYCGNTLGTERKRCVVTKEKINKFTIRYSDDQNQQQYFKLSIKVDRKCECLVSTPDFPDRDVDAAVTDVVVEW
ncbi:hypothetical protein Hamer_G001932 [Homarus americanus]|uniref:Platelet-derived growth factor (PDGF) family profile domain-containing protein n=1 Tax=Homarus americanus TaxID=6706 RepID=A0A8J5JVF1_HOMAM|nr:hypothetical protein Hamer_G001932 [Homarus americanus]